MLAVGHRDRLHGIDQKSTKIILEILFENWRAKRMKNATAKKALVIDDDPISRKKLCRILQRLGIEQVEESQTGEEALPQIKETSFDLIMVDWYMPGMTGLELLQTLRAEERTKQTSVFIVTTEGRQAQIISAIQAGATGYIMKPFSQESIKQKLSPFLPETSKSQDSDEDPEEHPSESPLMAQESH